MKTVIAILSIVTITSTAFAGTKLECFEKLGQKSQALLTEQFKQEAIAGDIRVSTSERAAAVAIASRLFSDRQELLGMVDTINNRSESADGFDCPIK